MNNKTYFLNEETYIQNIENVLNFRFAAIQSNTYSNFNDRALLAEGFFVEFLNLLFDWQLKNANEESQNISGFDLYDAKNKILVQVSAVHRKRKIEYSMNHISFDFLDERAPNAVWKFYFAAIDFGIKKSTATTDSSRIDFDQKKSVLGFEQLMSRVRHAGIDKLKQLSDLADKYSHHRNAIDQIYKEIKEYLRLFAYDVPSTDIKNLMKLNDLLPKVLGELSHLDDACYATEDFIRFIDDLKAEDLCTMLALVCCEQYRKNLHPPLYRLSASSDCKPLIYAEALVKSVEYASGENKCGLEKAIIRKRLRDARSIINTVRADRVFMASLEANELTKRLTDVCEKMERQWKVTTVLPVESSLFIPPTSQHKLNDADRMRYATTVFSQAFDSRRGADPNNFNHLQSNFIKWVCDGRTVILQGAQIVDNMNLLNLLWESSNFATLCKEGFIVYSPFSNFLTPKQYLLNRLNSKTFTFSSYKSFNNSAEDRSSVIKGLSENWSYQELRSHTKISPDEKLRKLYEAYLMLDDVFGGEKNEEIRRRNAYYFHQEQVHGQEIKPNMMKTAIVDQLASLSKWKDERRERLVNACISFLEPCEHYLKRQYETETNKNIWMRSNVDQWIKYALQKHKEQTEELKYFSKVLDRAYNVFMGQLCCADTRTISDDPDLVVAQDPSAEGPQPGLRVDFEIRLYQTKNLPSKYRNLTWDDLKKEAEYARDLEVRNNMKLLSADKYVQEKLTQGEMDRKLIYTDNFGRPQVEPTGFSYKNTKGETYTLSEVLQGEEQPIESAIITGDTKE